MEEGWKRGISNEARGRSLIDRLNDNEDRETYWNRKDWFKRIMEGINLL